jgi:hypothetical protein
MRRTLVRRAHEPGDAMLAARLAGFPQVKEDTGRTVDAVTRRERRPNQTKQAGVFSGAAASIATGRPLLPEGRRKHAGL